VALVLFVFSQGRGQPCEGEEDKEWVVACLERESGGSYRERELLCREIGSRLQ